MITAIITFLLVLFALYGGSITLPMIQPWAVVLVIAAGVIYHIWREHLRRYYRFRNVDFFGCDQGYPVSAKVAFWVQEIGNGAWQMAFLGLGFWDPLFHVFQAGMMISDSAIHILMKARSVSARPPGYRSGVWALLPGAGYLIVNNWPGAGAGPAFGLALTLGVFPFLLNLLTEYEKARLFKLPRPIGM